MEAHIYAMDPATWVPIADLRYPDDVQRKVRVVGFCESYDIGSAKATLVHESASLIVDLALIVENHSFSLPGRCKLMCIGTLEVLDAAIEAPEVHSPHQAQPVCPQPMRGRAREPAPASRFVLLAIFAQTMEDLDLRLWARAARQMRQSLPPRDP